MRTASERADEDDEKVKEKVGKEWIDESGGKFWCSGWCTRCSNFKFLDRLPHFHIQVMLHSADQYVAHKATNKYWNTGIGLVALKATGVPKSDPKIGKIQK